MFDTSFDWEFYSESSSIYFVNYGHTMPVVYVKPFNYIGLSRNPCI